MSAQDLPAPAPAPTPTSEQSVYFDAPIMHFFSRNKSEGEKPANTNAIDDSPAPVADTTGSVLRQEPATRQPFAGSVPNPVVNRYHEHLDQDQGGDAAQEPEARQPVGRKVSVGTNTEPRARASSPPSDSGYGSSSPTWTAPTIGMRAPERSALRTSRTSFKPVPVVWKDGQPPRQPDTDDETHHNSGANRLARHSASMRSFRSSASRRDRDGYDHESVRSAPASRFSERRRRASLSGGSFAGGAGCIGPGATPRPDDTESFVLRAQNAKAELTPKQESKIEKASAKEGKRLSKVLKSEAKSEAKAIEQAIRELADIQKMQKDALKEESRAVATHAKALRAFHKEELEYLAARARYDKAQAELAVVEDAREAARDHALEVTEMMQEKSKEVEWLRSQKAADDRERSAKLVQLTGKA